MEGVIPFFKSQGGGSVDKYRPVAVLSNPAKAFESAIHRAIFYQLRPQLSEAQHRFLPGRSTMSNLVNYMAQLIPAVDEGRQVDTIYFDVRKAFNVVDNDILLKKLANMGCTPHLLQFFSSYMRDRYQYVDYTGFTSEPYSVRSGVVKGVLWDLSNSSL
ncbi:uncharacterized protein LOC131847755 [Achroia grisella]|uniref:uncharacterized protein LOC131847755 n=1 Tax=Achroia grisella TaxID=688607 RepID=UPI0027D2E8BF|nr:uncharacterized protein LOC131847755 [Achroia grisella]